MLVPWRVSTLVTNHEKPMSHFLNQKTASFGAAWTPGFGIGGNSSVGGFCGQTSTLGATGDTKRGIYTFCHLEAQQPKQGVAISLPIRP